MMTDPDPAPPVALWVFGYGSLVWNPGFPYVARALAVLPDYHRSFCMRSIHHRGTHEDPGLVLALDARVGARCSGVVFGVAAEAVDETLSGLRERELVSSAYLEVQLELTLQDGGTVEAVTYVVDPAHVQYCGNLSLDDQARTIAQAVGGRGTNRDYLINTALHLRELGLRDAELEWLVARVGELAQQAS